MRQVPLIKPDLPTFESVEQQFREILGNGRITNFGKYVTQLEQDAAAYLGVPTVTLSSGTMGMVLVLQALGLQKGQKVILPSFTFNATGQAILYAGGIPVFAEVNDELNLCPKDLEALLAKHDDVFGVIPVHVFGLPARVDEIDAVVQAASAKRQRPIRVVYDAAHAFGSERDQRKVGTFGDAEVFSLSVTKVLVTVEGGMVASRDHDLIQRLKKMRNWGIESNYRSFYPGLNGKMSEFHAIVGIENLKRVEGYMAARQERARRYVERVRSLTEFVPCAWPENVRHTFKDFSVMTPAALEGKRDAVIAFLKEQGVETRAYFFPPLHEQEYFRPYVDRALPVTERLSRRVITLPFFTTISDDDMDYVAASLARTKAL